jgi:hypothetical protein
MARPLTKYPGWKENEMHTQPHDTPSHIQKMIIEGYRKMSAQQKLRRVDELTLAVQQLALARIRKRYDTCSERQQRLRLASDKGVGPQ